MQVRLLRVNPRFTDFRGANELSRGFRSGRVGSAAPRPIGHTYFQKRTYEALSTCAASAIPSRGRPTAGALLAPLPSPHGDPYAPRRARPAPRHAQQPAYDPAPRARPD